MFTACPSSKKLRPGLVFLNGDSDSSGSWLVKVQVLVDALTPTQRRNAVLPTQALQHNADLLFGGI